MSGPPGSSTVLHWPRSWAWLSSTVCGVRAAGTSYVTCDQDLEHHPSWSPLDGPGRPLQLGRVFPEGDRIAKVAIALSVVAVVITVQFPLSLLVANKFQLLRPDPSKAAVDAASRFLPTAFSSPLVTTWCLLYSTRTTRWYNSRLGVRFVGIGVDGDPSIPVCDHGTAAAPAGQHASGTGGLSSTGEPMSSSSTTGDQGRGDTIANAMTRCSRRSEAAMGRTKAARTGHPACSIIRVAQQFPEGAGAAATSPAALAHAALPVQLIPSPLMNEGGALTTP